jgi:hypothetical protein
MKCFIHPQIDAVGICKNCNKGLCKECAIELENGIACKDKCENQVIAINDLIEKNKRAYETTNISLQTTSDSYKKNSIWLSLLGILFLLFGIIAKGDIFTIALGIAFLIGAVFCFITWKKYKKLQYK